MAAPRAWPGWSPGPKPEVTGEGPKRRSCERRLAEWRDRDRVRQVIRDLDPELYQGRRNLTRNEAECSALFEHATAGTEGEAYRHRHNFLLDCLQRGCKKLGWDIPCPGPVTLLYPERPAFTVESARCHNALGPVDAAHRAALRDPAWLAAPADNPYLRRAVHGLKHRADTADLAAGRILYQAIRHGGLLARPALRGLGQAALETLTLERDGTVTLAIPLEGKRSELLPPRRFHPDPVTALMLLGFRRRHDWPDREAEWLVWLYLRGLGLDYPRSGLLAWLTEGAALGLQLETDAPPFLVRYAQTAAWSPSLPDRAWLHLVHGRVGRIEQRNRARLPPVPRFQARTSRKAARSVLAVRRAIPTTLKANQKAEARRQLEAFLEANGEPGTLPTWLAEWARYLLAPKNWGGREVQVTTALTYLSAIAVPLEREMLRLDRDPEPEHPLDTAGLAEHQWQTLYDRVLESAPTSSQRSRRAFHLADFHEFLRCSDATVPTVDIEAPAGTRERVDANLVPPPAFNRAIRIVRQATRHPRTRTICELVMVLGYRLGMRRGEVAGLSLADVVPAGLDGSERLEACLAREPQLIVRTNHWRVLKGGVGARHLPLAVLLTPAELRRLLAWHAERVQETNQPLERSPLFTLSANDNQPVPEKLLTRATYALQIACGDRAIRFHHLRHSLASILVLRCLARDYPELLPREWLYSGHRALLPLPDGSLVGRLLGQDADSVPNSRRLLQIVSAVLGHVDPHSTVGNYIHTFDQALGATVRAFDPRMTPQEQAIVLGTSAKARSHARTKARTAGYAISREQPPSELLTLLARRAGHFQARANLRGTYRPLSIDRAAKDLQRRITEDDAATSAMAIYRVLSDFYQGCTAQEVARRHAIAEATARRWYACALARFQRHITRKGKPRLGPAANGQSISPDKLPALPGLCPAPPRSTTATNDAERYFRRLLAWHEEEPDRMLAILEKYLNQTTYREPDVTFRDEDDFRDFIELLDRAGVDPLRIQLRIRPNLSPDAPTPAAQREYWAQSLGLPVEQAHNDPDRMQSSSTQHPMGRLKLLLCDQMLRTPHVSAWEEFRFAIFAASIHIAPPYLESLHS